MNRNACLFVAALASAFALSAPATAAPIYTQDFETISLPSSDGFFFAGGGGHAATSTIAGGVGNPGKAVRLESDAAGAGGFWFHGVALRYIGALPTTDLSELWLTADMLGSETAATEFRIESHTAGYGAKTGQIEFGPTVGTSWDTHGGLLSSGVNSTFDPSATHFLIVAVITSIGWGADDDNVLLVDNINFAIPEPASFGAMAILLGAAGWRRGRPRGRRSGCGV